MTRDEALALLRGGPDGVLEWNRYRIGEGTIPSLSHVDLRYANLSSADLHGSDLTKADLRGARLIEACLVGAHLLEANLFGANLDGSDLRSASFDKADLRSSWLRGADLTRAVLSETNLNGADLSRANLGEANLGGADLIGTLLDGASLKAANLFNAKFGPVTHLRGADFTGAKCLGTIFAYVDLSEAKGLETISHAGPTTIGTDTLIQSRGKIPEVFLRGCGLPDVWLAYIPILVNSLEPIQFYSVFISYSAKDRAIVERIYADLQAQRVRCWYAPEDLKIGERFRVGIDEAIRVHDKLLLVLSKHSVASDWVEKEVETAMEQERRQKRTVLFPIRLDDAVMKIDNGWPGAIKRTRNLGDFRKWKDHDAYGKSFERLLRDLKAADPVNARPR